MTGTALPGATVTVNNQPVYRRNDYFHELITVDNSAAAVYPSISVVGARNVTTVGGEDTVSQQSGRVFIPAANESFIYDLDGNLISDGRWQYTWDAENRLTSMTGLPGIPAEAKKKLEFAYDHHGRRIQKKVYIWNIGTSLYQLQSVTKFVYDGWNLIAELNVNNTLIKTYVQTNKLLMIRQGNESYFVAYDGNENVTSLTKSSTGKISAQYDYDPFGNTLQESGEAFSISPFRFSGKYLDRETNLIYYGYRYYNPQIGAWISKDPIAEDGGINLYNFVLNNAVNSTDLLGLVTKAGVQDGTEEYSCRCGWLDWNHISVGSSNQPHRGPNKNPTSAWALWQKVSAPGMKPGTRTQGGFLVYQNLVFLGGYVSFSGNYFVKNNLYRTEKESVALAIFMNLHFQKEQSTKKVEDTWKAIPGSSLVYTPAGSGFAEEDLPSNIISFYAAVYNYDRARIQSLCEPIGRDESLKLLEKTGEGNRNPSWQPKDYNNKCSCCAGKRFAFNQIFGGIKPAARGNLWDMWNEKHQSLLY